MKGAFILSLVLVVTTSCSREGSQGSVRIADSVSRHVRLEKLIWDYYVSIEKDVRMDLGVSEAETVERVQSLINDGYVKIPVILVITEEGARWKAVDYSTYKEYMTSNAVPTRRYYGIQPNILDSLLMDSIRSNLLEALEADSVNEQ